MENYAANSHLSKIQANKKETEETSEEKRLEKIVTGNVRAKKKSSFAKFTGKVIQEDGRNVASYIFGEVLIPALKKAISDVVTNGIDMLLYGESGKTKKSPGSRISYNSIYDGTKSRSVSRYSTVYDYDDVIIDNRGEAEEVLARMDEIIDRYGVVSVLDFYDLVGITGRHTDNKYGWTDIRSASIQRVRDGYIIKLPRALAID